MIHLFDTIDGLISVMRVTARLLGSCHVYVSGVGAGGVKGESGHRAGSWNWTGGHCGRPAW